MSEAPSATLNWDPNRGFELDFNAETDDITVRMVTVPIPADGTNELRGGPLSLDRLEILFKAQVDIEGEPGQLAEATVQVVEINGSGESLVLDAKVEDAETGELFPFKATAPIIVPHAPASGGPRPTPTSEDELDFDDEDTLSRLFGADQLAAEARGEKVAPPPKPKPDVGIDALLARIANLDDEADDDDFGEDDPTEAYEPPQPIDLAKLEQAAKSKANDMSGEEALLKAVFGQTPGLPPKAAPEASAEPTPAPPAPEPEEEPAGIDQTMSADDEARGLLNLLVGREDLELEEGFTVDDLIGGVVVLMALPRSADAMASALSGWLLEQDSVADLYIDDDSLAEILAQW